MPIHRYKLRHLPEISQGTEFEKEYIALRSKENRIYSDEELQHLPNVEQDHPHFSEWQIRNKSAQRFIRHLTGLRRSLNILEIGCGNGWLSHKMACLPGVQVTGIDINKTELDQARRVFHH